MVLVPDIKTLILEAVQERNNLQKRVLFEKITARFGRDLRGLTFAVWGLAFKPETGDVREAPSIALLHQLIDGGASVRAHDPAAMQSARRALPPEWFERGRIRFFDLQYDAVTDANALVLVTEWRSFRSLDVDRLARSMKTKIIFDGRNQYGPSDLRAQGFEYFGIGR